MSDIKIFDNPEFGKIRALDRDGEPWMVGKDVAQALGYQNGSRDINRHVDPEDRRKIMFSDGNQNKETIIINESGLYSLVLGSCSSPPRSLSAGSPARCCRASANPAGISPGRISLPPKS